MATTDYDFTLTRNQIIERALRIVGALAPGQNATGEQIVQGSMALNGLVKRWQNNDLYLWKLVQETLSFSTGESSKTLGNHVLGIDMAWYIQSNTNIPIKLIPYREYLELLTTTSSSPHPTYIAQNYDKSTPTVYIWPKASEAVDVYVFAYNRLKDMDTASSNPDIPQRFEDALVYGLADSLADEYRPNMNTRQLIKSKYDEFLFTATSTDKEYKESDIAVGSYED